MNSTLSRPSPIQDFIGQLRARSGRVGARIGFPEADEVRTAEAIELLSQNCWVVPRKISEAEGGLEGALRRLKAGELDGVVAGAVHSTAEVILHHKERG